MKKYSVFLFFILLFALLSCNEMSNSSKQTTMAVDSQLKFTKGTFGYDLDFLKKYHKDLVLLEEEGTGAKVIVLPAYQGRVMTSSAQELSTLLSTQLRQWKAPMPRFKKTGLPVPFPDGL